MVSQVFSIVSTVFASLVSWFELIITESGFGGVYLGGIFLVLLAKYLLQPLFGSAGSDKASRKKADE